MQLNRATIIHPATTASAQVNANVSAVDNTFSSILQDATAVSREGTGFQVNDLLKEILGGVEFRHKIPETSGVTELGAACVTALSSLPVPNFRELSKGSEAPAISKLLAGKAIKLAL